MSLDARSLQNWNKWTDLGVPSMFGVPHNLQLTSVPEKFETVEEDSLASCGLNVLECVLETDLPPFKKNLKPYPRLL